MKLQNLLLMALASLTIACVAQGHGTGYWGPVVQKQILSAFAAGDAAGAYYLTLKEQALDVDQVAGLIEHLARVGGFTSEPSHRDFVRLATKEMNIYIAHHKN